MKLRIGDRVCYSDAFLRMIGGPRADVQRRGVVLGIEGIRNSDMASVRWDDFPGATSLVLGINLTVSQDSENLGKEFS